MSKAKKMHESCTTTSFNKYTLKLQSEVGTRSKNWPGIVPRTWWELFQELRGNWVGIVPRTESLNNGSMHREDRNKQGVLGGVPGTCARTPHPRKRCSGCFRNE